MEGGVSVVSPPEERASQNGTPLASNDAPKIETRTLLAVMGSVLLGMLLAALDQTVVGPAMPKIIGELGGFNQYSWVFTSYLLTSTITVPIFGKLSDMYGRKWFYVGGIVVFLVGSMLSGMSADITQLIIFRGIQGFGAGIIFASAFAIVADLIPPANRGKWQGAFGAVWGLSSVVGPSLGGFLTDSINWRWVFYVNLPVGIVALAVIIALYPRETPHPHNKVIDWLGAGLLVMAITPLLLALSLGGTPDWAWSSVRIISLFAVAVIGVVAFIVVEARAKEPIIPLDLFKNRIFTLSILTVFTTGVGLFGATLYIPLFIQAIQGGSATESGNSLTPMMISVVIASVLSGQIISRTGKYRIIGIVGMAFVTVGMFLLYTMGMDTQRLVTISYMVLLGLGMGITFPLYTLVVQNAFPMNKVGVVTSALQFFRSIGGTVGVAVLGGIVNSTFHEKFPAEFAAKYEALKATVPAAQAAGMPPASGFLEGLSNLNPQLLTSTQGVAQLKAGLVDKGVPLNFVDTLFNVITDAMKSPLFTGIQIAFLIGAVLFAVGLVTTSFLEEIPLRATNDHSRLSTPQGGSNGKAAPGDGWSSGDKVAAEATKAGKEMAVGGMPGGTVLPARDEPTLVGK
jgi:EmrB/QacA subfamily drug resistance transporter